MNAETVATIIGTLLLIYLCCGIAFSIAFLFKGISKVDATTHGSSLGFKIIITPGVIALWPLLLKKWIRAKSDIMSHAKE